MGKLFKEYYSMFLNDGPCCETEHHELCGSCDDFKENWKVELFNRINCALLHDMKACSACKKCGSDCFDARINLADELAELLGVK